MQASPSFRPRTAVILAAGQGSRLGEGGVSVPKPLFRIGDKLLLERCLLTLAAAGVTTLRVVIGHRGGEIKDVISALPSLRGLDVVFVDNPRWELGNGLSLDAGARGVTGSFLLTMADHVMEPRFIELFLAAVASAPSRPGLATDPDIAGVFDLPDATKVLAEDGWIKDIGKQIERYTEIDTGLFYFPAGADGWIHDAIDTGATSVSHVMGVLLASGGVHAHQVRGELWQDVDDADMAVEAEARLAARAPAGKP